MTYLVLNEQGQGLNQQVTSAMNVKSRDVHGMFLILMSECYSLLCWKSYKITLKSVLDEQSFSKIAASQATLADHKELIREYNKSHATTK